MFLFYINKSGKGRLWNYIKALKVGSEHYSQMATCNDQTPKKETYNIINSALKNVGKRIRGTV
jgi:hypothetical protein